MSESAKGSPFQSEPVIRLTSITKSFGDERVVDAVDLDVADGQVLAIIGPSGAGKSTLLRCVNYLERPDHGLIRVADQVVDADASPSRHELAALRRKVGMVFQSFNLFPHLTVLQNVSFAQQRTLKRSRADADERSIELLRRVGMEQKADTYPNRCSGGQQQRVAIARALALDPKAMLFDEPTSALDPELAAEVLTVMRQLADEGTTMMVVTHAMHFARDVADEVAVMADGRVIERGPARQVFASPQLERTAKFLHTILDQ